ncbi:MAG: cation transporter [Chloroflexi bacterium]|uniref:Cation diffusion facilitator family transporter n=1 Tax=Candidatus Chlorohelix allophototropha TaxID=3003348 RepID=A0A8T7LW29_9CHLR|nr:cation transporter [Chloroflexota bacterium]WJW65581.1 cation diffusion facilitator family transporter [Chloroflexota bacterium L227-S17]
MSEKPKTLASLKNEVVEPHEHDHDDHEHSHDDHEHDHEDEHSRAHTLNLEHNHDDHEHDHDDHDHEHGHDHDHNKGFFGRIFGGLIHSHAHEGEGGPARYMQESARGIWAIKISLGGLALTALFQVVIVIISGSAGLLADTIHNFADALTAIPLWIAFVIGRRAANRRYTYGYGRAEDIAGLFVVLIIFISVVVALYESIDRIVNPQPITNIGWVMAAAIIGFIGNEAVAFFRITVGREINSAALIADGQHARADGLTSLAVLAGAVGVLLGFPLADPIVGLLITGAIILILKDSAKAMYHRVMDAIDPAILDKIEREAKAVEGVRLVDNLRARWHGHKIFAELSIEVDGALTTSASHDIGEEVRHRLWHSVTTLEDAVVHVDPYIDGSNSHHDSTAHHLRANNASK